ncbi:MAG: hypothetical protein AAGF45_01225 [Pseudomonadota bacterium]
MNETTVVSLQEALDARTGPTQSVSLDDLRRRQSTIPLDRCHAAFVDMSFELKLKTQHIPVFQKLSVAFPRGRKMAVLAHAGAGSDTMLELLQQRVAPTRGHVLIRSRISWPSHSIQFLEQRLSVKDNVVFLAAVIGLPQQDFLAAVTNFCQLTAKTMREPVRNLPIWARRRFAFLTLVSCNFDCHLLAQPFRPNSMNLQADEAAHAEALLFGRDYLITIEHTRQIPANCDLAYILYNGWLYGFDDVGEAAAIFDGLPIPEGVSARPQRTEEDDDDDDPGETIL